MLGAIAVICGALAVTGCASPPPLVPQSVVDTVTEEGRERTYDLAWQNTRQLVVLVEAGTLDQAEPVALELAARLHRLENGEAGNLSDRATARSMARFVQEAAARTREQNTISLGLAASTTQEHFDAGDFERAKQHSLEVLATIRVLRDEK